MSDRNKLFSKKVTKNACRYPKNTYFCTAIHNRGEVGEWLKPTVC